MSLEYGLPGRLHYRESVEGSVEGSVYISSMRQSCQSVNRAEDKAYIGRSDLEARIVLRL